jgi:plasmid stabilization system protein ParE
VAKPIEFHEEAFAELEAAFDWYFAKSERVASEFLLEMNRAIETITQHPNRWPVGIRNTRRFLLHSFPFAVVYRELASKVQVVAIAHGRRRAGYWRGRV